MSQSVVHEILRIIDQLSEPDREILQQQLRQRDEAQCRQKAEAARGTNQGDIDEAVRKLRYGA